MFFPEFYSQKLGMHIILKYMTNYNIVIFGIDNQWIF